MQGGLAALHTLIHNMESTFTQKAQGIQYPRRNWAATYSRSLQNYVLRAFPSSFVLHTQTERRPKSQKHSFYRESKFPLFVIFGTSCLWEAAIRLFSTVFIHNDCSHHIGQKRVVLRVKKQRSASCLALRCIHVVPGLGQASALGQLTLYKI